MNRQVDVCMINAGNIRNNTAYPFDKTTFTHKDLKASTRTHKHSPSSLHSTEQYATDSTTHQMPPKDHAQPTQPPTAKTKKIKNQAEVPFPCEMVVVRAPGTVLSDLLAFSRRFALQDPPVEKGGYLQVCFGFVHVCMRVCV